MKAEPIYAKSAPRIRAARIARPLAIAPDSAIGPSNHCRVSATKASGDITPAWPPAPADTRIRPSAPFSTALWANFWLITSWKTMQPQPWAAWLSSSRAPSEVIIIGTLCFSHSARSCSRRLLDLCTIWLTANGADGRSGCALSWAASSSLIRASHSSSSAGGRAFSAGNDPTTPALHCAITRSGTEMMNSGAPITGIDRRPLNKAGMVIRKNPFCDSPETRCIGLKMPDIIPKKQSQRATALRASGPIPALLAQSTGNVIVPPAIIRFSRPARNQHFRGAGFRGIGVKAASLLEALALTEFIGTELAVRRAVCRNRAYHAPRHHRGRFGQARQGLACLFCARVQIVDGLTWAFQGREDRQGFLEEFSHFVEHAWILF